VKKSSVCIKWTFKQQSLIVALPLNTANLPMDVDWEDTKIELQEIEAKKFENCITKENVETDNSLNVQDLFAVVPFGILRSQE